MKNSIETRLAELRAEFDKGQRALADLEAEQAALREQMLRIAGAIKVLQELLEEEGTGDG